jgi:hypothetical protein
LSEAWLRAERRSREVCRDRNSALRYLHGTVGVRELRNDLSRYLRRLACREPLILRRQTWTVDEPMPPAVGAELGRLILESLPT